MKKYCLLVMFLLLMQSCSFAATPNPTQTPIPSPIPTSTLIPPTPVGYGVDFPYDAPEEWREGNKISGTLDPDVVRSLVASEGKLDQSDNGNVKYLWTGNVPLELFVEPEDNGTGLGIHYDYWGTAYNVYAEDGTVTYILVIEKVMPQ